MNSPVREHQVKCTVTGHPRSAESKNKHHVGLERADAAVSLGGRGSGDRGNRRRWSFLTFAETRPSKSSRRAFSDPSNFRVVMMNGAVKLRER